MGGGSKGEISERVPGVSLAWENVNYVVETKIDKKVSGKPAFRPTPEHGHSVRRPRPNISPGAVGRVAP